MITNESIMRGGKYSGYLMSDIPAEYLLYVYENKKCSWDVRWYIERNYDEILKRKQNDDRRRVSGLL